MINLTGWCQKYDVNTGIHTINGNFHVFSVETPDRWSNNPKEAKMHGLPVLFSPDSDQPLVEKSYIYAIGFEKDDNNPNLSSFVAADHRTYMSKNPDLLFTKTKTHLDENLEDIALFGYYNLQDRYKEEVLYIETKHAFIVLTFSARTKQDYDQYQHIFEAFTESFKYLGTDPKAYRHDER